MIEYIGLTIVGLIMTIYGNKEKLLAWYLFGTLMLMLAGGWLAMNSGNALLQTAGIVQIAFGMLLLLYAVI